MTRRFSATRLLNWRRPRSSSRFIPTTASKSSRPSGKRGKPASATAWDIACLTTTTAGGFWNPRPALIRGDRGEVEKLVIVNPVITERKQAEEQLAHNALHESMRSKWTGPSPTTCSPTGSVRTSGFDPHPGPESEQEGSGRGLRKKAAHVRALKTPGLQIWLERTSFRNGWKASRRPPSFGQQSLAVRAMGAISGTRHSNKAHVSTILAAAILVPTAAT